MKTNIEMAREAGFKIIDNMIFVDGWEIGPYMQRFAELVFEQGRQEGMKQEPVLCQYAVDVAMPEYRCVGKCQYAAPPQRPWVELTGEEMESTCAGTWSYDPYVIARAIADKLKEKNT